MLNNKKKKNILNLTDVLSVAERSKYAVGSFSPRYIPMIRPVLKAGEKTNSIIIVQISQNELGWYNIKLSDFSREFYNILEEENITVPVVLHLDHTRDFKVIKEAIRVGFTSVMIDASDKSFHKNVEITSKVVKYAHSYGVSVEAELGKIGATDFIETEKDEELYTDPGEAKKFVEETGVDALAVSVGTAHGVYNKIRQPRIDYQRLMNIKKLVDINLVLHGGSGIPAEMVNKSIHLPGGGISKVNIATDLEVAFLKAVGLEDRLTNQECANLDKNILIKGQQAVEEVVKNKITNFLGSRDSAVYYRRID